MPFINSKITVKLSDEKKEAIKTKLGEAVQLIGKPESFLMVGFEDEYCLYFAGEKLEKGAFVVWLGKLVGMQRDDCKDL